MTIQPHSGPGFEAMLVGYRAVRANGTSMQHRMSAARKSFDGAGFTLADLYDMLTIAIERLTDDEV
jgi:hypothetical protein